MSIPLSAGTTTESLSVLHSLLSDQTTFQPEFLASGSPSRVKARCCGNLVHFELIHLDTPVYQK